MMNILYRQFCKIKYRILISGFILFFASTNYAASLTHTTASQPSPLIAEVLMKVQLDYVDLAKLSPTQMLVSALSEMSIKIPELQSIFDFKTNPHQILLTVETHSSKIDLPKLNKLDELNEVLQKIVHFIENHWSSPSQINRVETSLIDGMLSELDPHTLLLPKNIYNEFQIGTRGHFSGIGISIGFQKNKLIILSIVDGSPAKKAGILAKDHIIQIGDESTSNITTLETINKLRGGKGSKLILYIKREGFEEIKKFELIREVINIDSVQAFDLEGKYGKIRYLKIKNFQKSTTKDLVEKLKEVDQIKGLIIDLRDNPGGLLEQAVKVSDLFLSEKRTIVSTIGGEKQTYKSYWGLGYNTIMELPLIVIVNRSSASASEIVAAALKNNKRALLIGEQTFGKGSVQVLSELQDQSALKLTIAKYLTPGNQSIQSIGVTPDISSYPVVITDKKIQNLKPSLNHRGGLPPSNPVFLPYLLNSKEKKPKDDTSISSLKSQLENDFLVKLARNIFNGIALHNPQSSLGESLAEPSVGRPSAYQALSESAMSVYKKLMMEHDRVIAEKLEQQHVNWNVTKSSETPRFTVDLQTEVKLKDQQNWENASLLFPPEAMLRVKVSVTNTGENAISRLFMVTQSRKRFFDRWELPIGYLESGSTITKYTRPVAIPKKGINIIDAINFHFYDYRMQRWHSQKMLVAAEGREKTQFQFQLQIWDDGTYGSSGNGDHLLQQNETIALKLKVKNIGNQKSDNAIALIKKNKALNIDLIKDQIDLGHLAKGEEKEGVLLIKVKKDAIVADLDFIIEVHDDTIEKKHLAYNFLANSKVHDQLFQAPKIDYMIFDSMKESSVGSSSATDNDSFDSISANEQSQLGTTSSDKLKLVGKAQDDQQLKDVFIFLNKKKVFYQSHSGLNQTVLNFETSLNLSEGFNHIFVFARDQHNILSSKEVQIWRKGAKRSL